MVARRRGQRGVTLIELMIGLAVMAMLLLLSMPFVRGWIDGNRQMLVRNHLWEGVSQARALALRNPAAQPASQPAALLQRVENRLEVVVPGQAAPAWRAEVRADALLKLAGPGGFADAAALAGSGNPRFDCVAFDARGLRLPGATGCSDLDPALGRIAVGVGREDPLYVDML